MVKEEFAIKLDILFIGKISGNKKEGRMMKKKRINTIAAVILSLLFIIGCGGGGGGDSKKVIAEPKLSLSEASYDFGGVPVLKSEEKQFTITNTGTRDLRITGFSTSDQLTVPSNQFTVPTVSDNCSGKSVVPNGSCTFIARFTPAAHGPQSGTITINGDDPKTISLNGSGWLNVWINRITGDCSSGISIDVTVTNPLSADILGDLKAGNFVVTLGGEAQTLNDDNVVHLFPDPVSVVLALDMSPSQTANISTIRLAARSFIDQLQDGDEAMICMFSTLREFYPDDYFLNILTYNTDLKNYIQNNNITSGETTLYDSIYDSITRADEYGTKGKKAVVVLSDGVDTDSSEHDLNGVVAHAKEKGVLLFTIFYVDPNYYPNALADTLKQLASDTSGQYYNSGNSGDLTQIYGEIAKSLSNKYTITHTPSSCSSGLVINPQVEANWDGKTGQTSGTYTIP